MTPVRGTSTVPMTRNMCGRSFGNRPDAFVRLFGSRPNVALGATVLIISRRASAGSLQPRRAGVSVGGKCLPAVGVSLLRDHHESVVPELVAIGVGQQEPAAARGARQHEHRQCPLVGKCTRLLLILAGDVLHAINWLPLRM